jgi:hypothetical protein
MRVTRPADRVVPQVHAGDRVAHQRKPGSQPARQDTVSGMPYISVNSATRNAENAPIARQSGDLREAGHEQHELCGARGSVESGPCRSPPPCIPRIMAVIISGHTNTRPRGEGP